MVLHLVMKYAQSGAFVEDILKFVNTLVGEEVLKTSKYLFNKLFAPRSQMYFHFYCDHCGFYLGDKSSFGDQVTVVCQNPDCGQETNVGNLMDGNFFISIPLRQQIQDLFHRPDFKVVPHLNRSADAIRDIIDGQLYKEMCEPGNYLSDENSISLTFNTDGAKVFSSNNVSLWPIQLFINEIPPEDRFRQDNVLLAGLWCGRGSPHMNVYLKPFTDELVYLSKNGVHCVKPDGTHMNRLVIATTCSFDSVAKPKLLNMKQFNGAFACAYCMHPNIPVPDVNNQLRFVADTTYPNRTHEEMVNHMLEAHEKDQNGELTGRNNHVFGLKGLSQLLAIPGCNLVWGITIDYLHCLLEGVTAKLVDLWYNSLVSAPYHISEENQIRVDDFLINISPPQQAMCRPSKKLALRSEWSAKDWRAFLLYYCLPCLKGDILRDRYFENLKCLVGGAYILLKDSITENELIEADGYLQRFVKDFNALYGDRNMVYNIHLLTHMADVCRKFGPLWAYSNFPFESGNGHLLKLVRGTRGVPSQIAEKYLRVQFVSKYFEEVPVNDKVKEFCSDVMSYSYIRNSARHGDVTSLGSAIVVELTDDEVRALLECRNIVLPDRTISYFKRVVRENVLFYSKSYCKPTNFDDTCVRLSDNTYAVIDKIIRLQNDNSISAIISPLRITEEEHLTHHIKTCAFDLFAPKRVIPFSDILVKCVRVNLRDGRNFICEIPNFYERD